MGALLSLNSQIIKEDSIWDIRTTFPSLAEVIMLELFKELENEEPDLACIIRICLEEFSVTAITSSKDDPTSTIRPRMLGEVAGLCIAPTE